MSSDRRASRTALMVAGHRALASARPDALIHDPWAESLAGEDGAEYARQFAKFHPNLELWVALRTAFLDAQLRSRVSETRQVVILGAGLDARAARLATPGVRFFEVDQPESGALKQERLATLDGYPIEAATYVPCDFERDDFLECLTSAGFSRDEPAVLIWEGVVPYLTEQAVTATLAKIATCHPHSVLLFDYVNKNMVQGVRLDAADQAARDLVIEYGEPFRFGLNDPTPLLAAAGFRHVRTVSFDQVCLSLTGTYERERKFRFQQIALVSRGRPLDS